MILQFGPLRAARECRASLSVIVHSGRVCALKHNLNWPFERVVTDKLAPQASLHQLAAMLQSAVDAIISIDAAGIVESVNPATERLFGYCAAELVGKNVKMLMPEPYRSQHDHYISQYRQTRQRRIIGSGREVVGRRKDGSTFPMHLSVSEYDIDGERHFAGIVHDLTAQKLAEAESQRQETLFRAIINDAPQAIVIADESRKIYLVNPAVARIFGYRTDELIGKDARVLYASDDDYENVARLRLDFNAPNPDGGVDPIQVAFRRKGGETFPGEIIATIIRDQRRNVSVSWASFATSPGSSRRRMR